MKAAIAGPEPNFFDLPVMEFFSWKTLGTFL